MLSIDQLCPIPLKDSLNTVDFQLQKIESDSFSQIMPLKGEEATLALKKIKSFLNTHHYLCFARLQGGDCNAPILISKFLDSHKIPFAVLKFEPDGIWGEKRMRALGEMRQSGLDQLPCILKDPKGQYLVSLGESSFSCIEYLEPDSDQSSSIEQMFMLTSAFHAFSKRCPFTDELLSRSIDRYTDENVSTLDPELIKWYSSIFNTEDWANCVKCAHYFTLPAFHTIYDSLPTQLIHGDITAHNTLTSNGKRFFIDFDRMRTDIRLLDFAIFSGWSFLDRYLELVEKGQLVSCIQNCYGPLEEIEYKYFSHIVLFGRCGALKWALRELKRALETKDLQKEQQFATILNGAIREINQIYKRVFKMNI